VGIKSLKQITKCGCHTSWLRILSENADFAEKRKNNIIFIGPKSKFHIMGSKLAAKEAVKAYNIPMVPGLDEAQTSRKSQRVATEIGFPF
jgi:propionyl-CoA carboxylase alpha chain